MLLFLDTEFTDFIDCELISIGFVSEDGNHQLYLEVDDFRKEACNPFVQAAVLPQLGKARDAIRPKAEVGPYIRSWLSQFTEITLVCDSYLDLELLADILDGEWPANMKDRLDMREAMATKEFQTAQAKFHTLERPWHHALHDAERLRQGWLAFSHSL